MYESSNFTDDAIFDRFNFAAALVATALTLYAVRIPKTTEKEHES
jgi:hypothetical protein